MVGKTEAHADSFELDAKFEHSFTIGLATMRITLASVGAFSSWQGGLAWAPLDWTRGVDEVFGEGQRAQKNVRIWLLAIAMQVVGSRLQLLGDKRFVELLNQLSVGIYALALVSALFVAMPPAASFESCSTACLGHYMARTFIVGALVGLAYPVPGWQKAGLAFGTCAVGLVAIPLRTGCYVGDDINCISTSVVGSYFVGPYLLGFATGSITLRIMSRAWSRLQWRHVRAAREQEAEIEHLRGEMAAVDEINRELEDGRRRALLDAVRHQRGTCSDEGDTLTDSLTQHRGRSSGRSCSSSSGENARIGERFV